MHVGLEHRHDVRMCQATDAACLLQPLRHALILAALCASARISLTATSRSNRASRASQTVACAPWPSMRTSSKRPSCAGVPVDGAVGQHRGVRFGRPNRLDHHDGESRRRRCHAAPPCAARGAVASSSAPSSCAVSSRRCRWPGLAWHHFRSRASMPLRRRQRTCSLRRAGPRPRRAVPGADRAA